MFRVTGAISPAELYYRIFFEGYEPGLPCYVSFGGRPFTNSGALVTQYPPCSVEADCKVTLVSCSAIGSTMIVSGVAGPGLQIDGRTLWSKGPLVPSVLEAETGHRVS